MQECREPFGLQSNDVARQPEISTISATGANGREKPTPEGDGLNPTRYGDWEKNGRCIDF